MCSPLSQRENGQRTALKDESTDGEQKLINAVLTLLTKALSLSTFQWEGNNENEVWQELKCTSISIQPLVALYEQTHTFTTHPSPTQVHSTATYGHACVWACVCLPEGVCVVCACMIVRHTVESVLYLIRTNILSSPSSTCKKEPCMANRI
jgi:hypothetical protein